MPRLDGLKFIAIMAVLFYHLEGYIIVKDLNVYKTGGIPGLRLFDFGTVGVPLFFLLSGFILAKPFAQMLLKRGRRIKLKAYFLRRLTRLEPPYIIVMSLLFVGSVFILKDLSFTEGLKSYLASIFYSHNFIYGNDTLPLLNAVAWSLEIEIQFYILMPLFAYMFLIRPREGRRAFIFLVGFASFVLEYFIEPSFKSIFNYLEYFFAGILLADVYVLKRDRVFLPYKGIVTVMSLALLFFLDTFKTEYVHFSMALKFSQLFLMYFVCWLVLVAKSMPVLSTNFVSTVGGMCYTIYLIHYPVISLLGREVMTWQISDSLIVNRVFMFVILLYFVLLISSVFYLIIERPCMDKEWPKKLYNFVSKIRKE